MSLCDERSVTILLVLSSKSVDTPIAITKKQCRGHERYTLNELWKYPSAAVKHILRAQKDCSKFLSPWFKERWEEMFLRLSIEVSWLVSPLDTQRPFWSLDLEWFWVQNYRIWLILFSWSFGKHHREHCPVVYQLWNFCRMSSDA